ncbi:MAG: hypothetical protein Q7T33_09725 [Dehalococcoidia bacterium]|nr:hypothetical protein [Dehalococcoidia bacterium]
MANSKRGAAAAGVLAAEIAFAFSAGVVEPMLGDEVSIPYLHSTWLLSLHLMAAAAMVALALEVLLGSDAILSRIGIGAVLFVVLLVLLISGTFVAYLDGWGGLEVRELEYNADNRWWTILEFLLWAAVWVGGLFGALVGLLSAVWHALRLRRGSVTR